MADKKLTERELTDSILNQKYSLHDLVSRIYLDHRFSTDFEISDMTGDENGNNKRYPRVSKCRKIPFNGNHENHVSNVTLLKSESGQHHFGGLQTCGSVWSCPVCSAKISAFRMKEIQLAFDNWHVINEKHTQIMVTFTIPHLFNQKINDLRSVFMAARRQFKKQLPLKRKPWLKPFVTLLDDYGIAGTLTGIEVTYGKNGWHPHSHDIYFLLGELTDSQLSDLQTELSNAWVYACWSAKVPMSISQKHYMYKKSVQVRRAKSPSEYIAKFGIVEYEKNHHILDSKWGASQELALSHVKSNLHRKSLKKGFSPWDLLRLIQINKSDEKVYFKYARLFREYTRAFKGARQLFWSKGFKALLHIKEYTDQEIADLQEENSTIEGTFNNRDWMIIIQNNLRGKILHLANKGSNYFVLLEYIHKFPYHEKANST